MARNRRRGWRRLASRTASGAVGLGLAAAALSALRSRRHSREAGDRTSGPAQEASGRPEAAAASREARRRGQLTALGAVLLGRAVLGRGLLRIPFGLLGLSTLARSASTSLRGQAALASATRAVRSSTSALRSFSRAAAERAAAASGRAGGTILGPDERPV